MPDRTSANGGLIKAQVVAWVLGLAVLFCAQGPSAAGNVSMARNPAPRGRLPQPPSLQRSGSHGHLYVLSGSVYRYPLAEDGLPSKVPDGVMTPVGMNDPTGLAVDSAGNMFVSDAFAWDGAVAEFAAGSTGPQHPTSVLFINNKLPDYLKMDAAGRLYVHLDAGQVIAIFAPGARSYDRPISIIPPYKWPDLVTDYVITQSGTLIVLNLGVVTAYEHPLRGPTTPDWFLYPAGKPTEFLFYDTLALDAATNELYINFLQLGQNPWGKDDFAIHPARRPDMGRQSAPVWILGDECGPASNPTVDTSVIVKKYFIAGCLSTGKVLVYRKDRFGKQRTVEVIAKGMGPLEIAVGP